MAFVCPSQEDSARRREILCKLRNEVDRLTEAEGKVPFFICPPPQCCPPCCVPCCPPGCMPFCCSPPTPIENITKEEIICKPPEVMVCYKVKKSYDKESRNSFKREHNENKLKQSKSRELRASILYVGCDCEKRNGLQDDCRRSECQGSPECLTKPNPTCGPSEFCSGKHLGRKNYKGSSGIDGGSDGEGGRQALEEYECYPAILDTSHDCPCMY